MRKLTLITIALITTLLTTHSANTEDLSLPNFNHIKSIDGLPSDVVYTLAADSYGYIWIGTNKGVARYDGYTTKCYDDILTTNPMRRNTVKSICVDREGVVWCGSDNGLFTINSHTEEIEQIEGKMFENNPIIFLYEYGDDIWISTFRNLYRYNKPTAKISNMSSKFAIRNRYIDSDEKGNLWVLSMNNDISIYDKQNDTYVRLPNNIDPKSKKKIIATSTFFEGGKTYISTWGNGIYEVCSDDNYQNIEYRKTGVKINAAIINVAKDNIYNYYWITTTNGLYIVDSLDSPKLLKYISTELNLSNTNLPALLFTPSEGILWLGSAGGGINQLPLNDPVIKNYKLSEINKSIKSNYISAMYEHDDKIWLGLNNSVMAMLDTSTGEVTNSDNISFIARNRRGVMGVDCIAPIKSLGEVWLGSSYNGIWRAKLNRAGKITSFSHFGSNTTLSFSNRINKIYEDSKGRIFVCSRDSKLIMYTLGENGKLVGTRLNNRSNREDDKFLYNTMVFDICEDPKTGEILFATDSRGVWRCKNVESGERHFKEVKVLHQQMEVTQTTTFLVAPDSTIWLATNNYGLAKYSSEKDVFEIDPLPLASNIHSINSLSIDKNNKLWLGTNRGIVWYDVEGGNVMLFDNRDGLSSNSFVNKSVVYSRMQNKIYYGGYNGYSTIDIETLKYNSYIPTPRITNVSLGDRSILHIPSKLGSNVERDESGTIALVNLYEGETNVNIEFTSLLHQNPTKTTFEYMLKGVDKSMRRAINGEHRASYNNLDSGSYQFEVKAYNDSGVISTESAILTIKVHPKWYNSLWAWLVWISILIGIVIYIAYTSVVRIRYYQSMRRARFEIEKSKEVNAAKLQFFANVSHEFLTPLTIISTGLEDLTDLPKQNEKLFNIIKGNTKRLIALTEEILEFRKAETGNLKLRVSFGDLRSLIINIANDDFLFLIRKKSLSLSIDCQNEPINGYFDRDKVTKILYNLLSNAYKYNVEGGEIYIRIEVLDYDDDAICQAVKISVTNTGSVISEEQQASLFKRFYDGVYRQFGTKGVGIGLSLTKELIELHKGEISVNSSKESGTTFTIILPMAKELFVGEEMLSTEIDLVHSLDTESEETNNHKYEETTDKPMLDIRRTILLVEDDPDCQYVINSYLSKSYNVLLAADGREALNIAQTQDIDVIVSDVMMPIMDGYELCRSIKRDIATSHIPFILLTAKRADESKIEGLNCGAEAYLTKPVEMKILEAQIVTLLNSRELLAERFKRGDFVAGVVGEPTTDESSNDFTSYNEQFMTEAIAVVKANLSNYDFDIKDFEAALNVTRSTLYRKLKSQVDMSPLEFVRNVRLQCAREILLSKGNSASIAEIAYHTGFNTPRYFTICFKREFGITPTQLLEERS